MTLSDYLSRMEMTETAFAAKLGVAQVTVNRYVRGARFPDRDTILKIERATDGRVAPADWYKEAAE